MDIRLEGLDDLLNYLDDMGMKAENLKDEALIAGGDLLKEKIQSEIYSHGLIRRTGEAQESITRTDPKNGELFVGTKGGAQVPGFYLYMHEFGYYNVVAQRFIAPLPLVSIVYENNKNAILDEYEKVFRRGLGI